MKKLFAFILAMLMVAGFAVAEDRGTFTTVVTKDADATLTTAEFDMINDVVTKIVVTGEGANIGGVYDIASASWGGDVQPYMVAEAEVLRGIGSVAEVSFNYPVKFTRGLTIRIVDGGAVSTKTVVAIHIVKNWAR